MKPGIISALEPSLNELESLWDYIGYDEDDRQRKLHDLTTVLQKTLYEIIKGESHYRFEIESQIESKNRKAAQICQTLRLPPYFPPRDLSCLERLRHIDNYTNELERQVKERTATYEELKSRILTYCERLEIKDISTVVQNISWHDLSVDKDYIPSEHDLKKLEEKSKELSETYNSLLSKYSTLCQDICRISTEIDYIAESELELSILNTKDLNTTSADVKLNQHILDDLQAWRLRLVKQKAMLVGTCDEMRSHIQVMWRRLNVPKDEQENIIEQTADYKPSSLELLQEEDRRCQELKWSHMKEYSENLRIEAEKLYDLSFTDDKNRFIPDDNTEETINHLEQTIATLQENYEKNKEAFEAVNQYQTLWKAYLEVEQKMKDPAILSNRGGILLKTDKEKKRLLKELPRMEAEVSSVLEKMNSQDFQIQGRTFTELVQYMWSEFNNEREHVRFVRKANKNFAPEDSRPNSAASLRDSSSSRLPLSPRKNSSATSMGSKFSNN